MSREVKTMKQALHDTIHRHQVLTVEAIAEELDMARSYLYRSALPDMDTDGPDASGVRFPAKKIVPLVRVTGDYQVLDTMERQVGRIAIPMPTPSACAPEALPLESVKAAAEFGHFMEEIAVSLQDGKITSEEKSRIAKEGWEAAQAIMRIVCSCDQVREG